MGVLYDCRMNLPPDSDMFNKFESAASRLITKLNKIDISDLGLSEYNENYLKKYYLQNIIWPIQISSYLLAWSIYKQISSLENSVVVDYGGGAGIISLLAKEIGFGSVLYNDIYDVSCKDAQIIGKALSLEADSYICGDIDELIHFVKEQKIDVNSIVSFDVIEHIYDFESFVQKLPLLSSNNLYVVFASTANQHNPIIKEQRMKMQKRIENIDRLPEFGHKNRDSLKSYLKLRKEIIANFEPSLSRIEIENIARLTRGLIKKDIENCVSEYIRTGTICHEPKHPTNTCDPLTGNWNEHLMDISYIKKLFKKNRFQIHIKSGFYSYSPQVIKKAIKRFLNRLILIFGNRGIFIAPYYVIHANYIKTVNDSLTK